MRPQKSLHPSPKEENICSDATICETLRHAGKLKRKAVNAFYAMGQGTKKGRVARTVVAWVGLTTELHQPNEASLVIIEKYPVVYFGSGSAPWANRR